MMEGDVFVINDRLPTPEEIEESLKNVPKENLAIWTMESYEFARLNEWEITKDFTKEYSEAVAYLKSIGKYPPESEFLDRIRKEMQEKEMQK